MQKQKSAGRNILTQVLAIGLIFPQTNCPIFWSSLLGLSCPLSLKPKAWNKQRSRVHELNLSSFIFPQDTMLCLPSFFLSVFLPSAQKQTHLLLSPCRRHGNPPFPMLWLAVVKFLHGSMCRSREEDDSRHQKLLWVCTSARLSVRKVHFPTSRD